MFPVRMVANFVGLSCAGLFLNRRILSTLTHCGSLGLETGIPPPSIEERSYWEVRKHTCTADIQTKRPPTKWRDPGKAEESSLFSEAGVLKPSKSLSPLI